MLGGGPPGDQGCVLLLIYINVCAFQIGHFTRTAERICHDALSFKGLDIRSRPFNFPTPGVRVVIFSPSVVAVVHPRLGLSRNWTPASLSATATDGNLPILFRG